MPSSAQLNQELATHWKMLNHPAVAGLGNLPELQHIMVGGGGGGGGIGAEASMVVLHPRSSFTNGYTFQIIKIPPVLPNGANWGQTGLICCIHA